MSEVKHTPTAELPKFIRGWTAPFHVTMDALEAGRSSLSGEASNG